MDFSDEQLMLLYGRGRREAFDELYRRHAGRLHGYVARMVGLPDADDLLQDVFVRVARAASGYRPTARFSTWLYRVATNVCLNALQRRRRHPHLRVIEGGREATTSAANPETIVIAAEGGRALQRALDGLTADQRAVFLLRQFQGMAYGAIAEALDMPLGTVKTNLCRARIALVRALGDRLDGGQGRGGAAGAGAARGAGAGTGSGGVKGGRS